jgi:hypothetical protein
MSGNQGWSLTENLIITTYLKDFRSKVASGTAIRKASQDIATTLLELYPEVFSARSLSGLSKHIEYWDQLTNGEYKYDDLLDKDKPFHGTIPNILWKPSRS